MEDVLLFGPCVFFLALIYTLIFIITFPSISVHKTHSMQSALSDIGWNIMNLLFWNIASNLWLLKLSDAIHVCTLSARLKDNFLSTLLDNHVPSWCPKNSNMFMLLSIISILYSDDSILQTRCVIQNGTVSVQVDV